MGATVILDVQSATAAGVEALEEFDGIPVDPFYRDTGKREFAYMRDATFEHSPASMKSGRHFRNEVGRFEFVIWVEIPGGTAVAAAARALELGTPFEEWVADNKQGVGGAYAIQVEGGGALKAMVTDRAAIAEAVYPVRYNARLT